MYGLLPAAVRRPHGNPFGKGLLVRKSGNVGAWRVPHKDALFNISLEIVSKRYRWGKCGWVDKICMNCYSPISLLLCQGTYNAKDGGNYVPHDKLKKMNEGKKGEHD